MQPRLNQHKIPREPEIHSVALTCKRNSSTKYGATKICFVYEKKKASNLRKLRFKNTVQQIKSIGTCNSSRLAQRSKSRGVMSRMWGNRLTGHEIGEAEDADEEQNDPLLGLLRQVPHRLPPRAHLLSAIVFDRRRQGLTLSDRSPNYSRVRRSKRREEELGLKKKTAESPTELRMRVRLPTVTVPQPCLADSQFNPSPLALRLSRPAAALLVYHSSLNSCEAVALVNNNSDNNKCHLLIT